MSHSNAPVLVRRSTLYDAPALDRLATLAGSDAPRGAYLVAEVEGAIVAAAPLTRSGITLADPALANADIRVLLTRWAKNLIDRRPYPIDAKAA
jgi:hypothetical protein